MKIPKSLDKALKDRTKAAADLMSASNVVDYYVFKLGVDQMVDEANYGTGWVVDEASYRTGCEVYVNPKSAEDVLRRAFESLPDDTRIF